MTTHGVESGDWLRSRSLREEIEEARRRLFIPPAPGDLLGPVTELRCYARFMDDLLRGVFARIAGEEAADGTLPAGLAVLATGGYGRLDLFPYSDVDLCVLHAEPLEEEAERIVRRIFQMLWDSGLRLSHAVRDLASCQAATEADLATATALMEARLVAGDSGLVERLQGEVLVPWMRRDGEQRLAQRLEEIGRRHRFYGSSPLVKEPNVKESMGGLRDYHAALWIERMLRLLGVLEHETTFPWPRRRAREPQAAALRAVATVSGARIALHMVHGRQHDQLDLASQLEVARWLGVSNQGDQLGVECFMRRTLRAAIELADLLEAAIEGHERIMRRGGRGRPRRDVGAGLVQIEESLYPTSSVAFEGAAGALCAMELFVAAQRLHVKPSRGAMVEIRIALSGETAALARDPSVASRLFAILAGRGNVGSILRAMHRCGLLGAIIPEFGDLTALVRFDPYHRYTVDEHSLRAVEEIDRVERGETGQGAPREVLDRIARLDLVKLALLVHDIGKSRGHGHVERGRVLVPGILTRLGLSEEDARVVLFLVNNHLLLSETLQKGDPSDAATLARVAETLGTAERLDMLYLVTRADMAATSPVILPRWQDTLLAKFYKRCDEILSGRRRDLLAGDARLRARILEDIEDQGLRRRATRHLDLVSRRYLMEVEPDEVLHHLDLLEGLGPERQVVIEPVIEEDIVTCWIVARDRTGLLADICGVFARERLDIVSADVMTRADGVALDRLRAVPGMRVPIEGHDLWDRIERDVALAGQGAIDLGAALSRLGERFTRGPRRPCYAASVHLDDRVSARRTVIEVSGPDRRGLLFEIARALAERGIEIVFARIATVEGKASDIFYVQEGGGKVAPARFAELQRVLVAVLERAP